MAKRTKLPKEQEIKPYKANGLFEFICEMCKSIFTSPFKNNNSKCPDCGSDKISKYN